MPSQALTYLRDNFPILENLSDEEITAFGGSSMPELLEDPEFRASYEKISTDTEPEEEGQGMIANFTESAVKTSIYDIPSSVASTLQVVTSPISDEVSNYFKETAESLSESGQEAAEEWGIDQDSWSAKFGSGAASLAPMLATGGGLGLLGAGVKLAQAGAYTAMTVQSFGGNYQEAVRGYKEQGASQDDAEIDAIFPALTGAGIELGITLAGGKFAKGAVPDVEKILGQAFQKKVFQEAIDETAKVATKGLAKKSQALGKGALLEGAEEGLSSLSNSAIAVKSYNPNLTWEESLTAAYEDTVVGAGLGGVIGMPGAFAGAKRTPEQIAETAGLKKNGAPATAEKIKRQQYADSILPDDADAVLGQDQQAPTTQENQDTEQAPTTNLDPVDTDKSSWPEWLLESEEELSYSGALNNPEDLRTLFDEQEIDRAPKEIQDRIDEYSIEETGGLGVVVRKKGKSNITFSTRQEAEAYVREAAINRAPKAVRQAYQKKVSNLYDSFLTHLYDTSNNQSSSRPKQESKTAQPARPVTEEDLQFVASTLGISVEDLGFAGIDPTAEDIDQLRNAPETGVAEFMKTVRSRRSREFLKKLQDTQNRRNETEQARRKSEQAQDIDQATQQRLEEDAKNLKEQLKTTQPNTLQLTEYVENLLESDSLDSTQRKLLNRLLDRKAEAVNQSQQAGSQAEVDKALTEIARIDSNISRILSDEIKQATPPTQEQLQQMQATVPQDSSPAPVAEELTPDQQEAQEQQLLRAGDTLLDIEGDLPADLKKALIAAIQSAKAGLGSLPNLRRIVIQKLDGGAGVASAARAGITDAIYIDPDRLRQSLKSKKFKLNKAIEEEVIHNLDALTIQAEYLRLKIAGEIEEGVTVQQFIADTYQQIADSMSGGERAAARQLYGDSFIDDIHLAQEFVRQLIQQKHTKAVTEQARRNKVLVRLLEFINRVIGGTRVGTKRIKDHVDLVDAFLISAYEAEVADATKAEKVAIKKQRQAAPRPKPRVRNKPMSKASQEYWEELIERQRFGDTEKYWKKQDEKAAKERAAKAEEQAKKEAAKQEPAPETKANALEGQSVNYHYDGENKVITPFPSILLPMLDKMASEQRGRGPNNEPLPSDFAVTWGYTKEELEYKLSDLGEEDTNFTIGDPGVIKRRLLDYQKLGRKIYSKDQDEFWIELYGKEAWDVRNEWVAAEQKADEQELDQETEVEETFEEGLERVSKEAEKALLANKFLKAIESAVSRNGFFLTQTQKEEAADKLQDLFIDAIRKDPRLNADRYAFNIVANSTVINYVKTLYAQKNNLGRVPLSIDAPVAGDESSDTTIGETIAERRIPAGEKLADIFRLYAGEDLSERQIAEIALEMLGKNKTEIAEALNITTRTIRTDFQKIKAVIQELADSNPDFLSEINAIRNELRNNIDNSFTFASRPDVSLLSRILERVADIKGKTFKIFTSPLKISDPTNSDSEIDLHRTKIQSDAYINSTNNQVAQVSRRLRAAIKSSYQKLSKLDLQNINSALTGDQAAIQTLPDEVAEVVNEMRTHIDDLTKYMIARGWVSGDLLAKMQSNLGVYLARSYEIFNNADYIKNLDPKVKNEAVGLVTRNLIAQGVAPAQAQIQAIQAVDDLLAEYSGPNGADRYYSGKLGAKNLSLFKKKKDIAPEIRALLGEYKDPIVNYTATVSRMSHFIGRQKMLNDMLKAGEGSIFFTKDDPRRQAAGANSRIPGGISKDEGAESSLAYSPLSGLYTTKEALEVLNQANEAQTALDNSIWNMIVKLNVYTKSAKTVFSLMTHARNLIGQPFMLALNGHLNPADWLQSVKIVKSVWANAVGSDKAAQDYYNKMTRLGLVGEEITTAELSRAIKDYADQINDATSAADLLDKGFGQTIKRLPKATAKAAAKIYQSTDEIGKILAYELERAKLAKLPTYAGLSEAQLDQLAAERVRGAFPTYSEMSPAMQTFRMQPIVGPFMSFAYESIRTQVNNLKYAKKEIQQGNIAYGLGRIAGQMLVASPLVGYVVAAISEGIGEVSDEEQKDLRTLLPFFEQDNTIFFQRDGDGKVKYINLSYLIPYSNTSDVMMSMLGMNGPQSEGDAVKKIASSAFSVLDPFISETMLMQSLVDISRNQDQYGNQVYNPEQDGAKIAGDCMSRFAWNLTPGTIERAWKRWRFAAQGKAIPSSGEIPELTDELFSEATGIKKKNVDYNQSLFYAGLNNKERLSNASSIFNRVAGSKGEVTSEEMISAYEEANESRYRIFRDIYRQASAARLSGMSNSQIAKAYAPSKMSKADIGSILTGTYRPFVPSSSIRKRAHQAGHPVPMHQIMNSLKKFQNRPLK